MANREITITKFRKEDDNVPQQTTMAWEDFVARQGKFPIKVHKLGNPAFSGAIFEEGKKRAKRAVEALNLIVLDFDAGNPEEVCNIIQEAGWEAVVSSTYSHTAEVPKFRVVMVPDRHMTTEEWPEVFRACTLVFPNMIDATGKDVSRMYFWSTKAGTDAPTFFRHIEGDPVGIDEMLELEGAELSLKAVSSKGGAKAGKDKLEEKLTSRMIADKVFYDLYGGGLWFHKQSFREYQKGHWKKLSSEAEILLKQRIFSQFPEATLNQVNEAFETLKVLGAYVPEVPDAVSPVMICVENGVLNPMTGELHPHAIDDRLTFSLPVEWDPEADAPRFLAFLEAIWGMEKDYQQRLRFIQQWFGYLLYNSCKFEKFLWLEGRGANGKSVLLKIMAALVGEENTSYVMLERLSKSAARAELEGKLLNIASEMSANATMADGYLKQFTSGEPVEADKKYRDSVSFVPRVKMACSTNTLPRLLDRSDGFARRAVIISFNRQFAEHERDVDLADKIIGEELSGILAFAVKGLRMLLDQGGFTVPQSSLDMVKDYRTSSDGVAMFVDEHLVFDPKGTLVDVLFEAFRTFCSANVFGQCSKGEFGRRLTALGVGKRESNGKVYRLVRIPQRLTKTVVLTDDMMG